MEENHMKLKTSTGSYVIVTANHENGKLKIEFQDKTCEELQEIFSDKNSLVRLEVYTDDDALMSVIPGYVVLESIVLQGDTKTVVLAKETDDVEQRITELSESLSGTAQEAGQAAEATAENTADIERLKADLDYMAMSLEVSLDE